MYLNELSKEIAEYTNSSENDVELRSRILRKNGIIAKSGGHGRSAQHVSYEDAIHLLLAVVINEKASDAHKRTTEISKIKLNPSRQSISIDPILKLKVFEDQKPHSITLFESLLAIIRDISSGKNEMPLIRSLTITKKELNKENNETHIRVSIDYFNDRNKFLQSVSFKKYHEPLKEIVDDNELLELIDPNGPPIANKYLQSNFGKLTNEFHHEEDRLNITKNKSEFLSEIKKRWIDAMKIFSNKKPSLQELESISSIQRQYRIGGQIFYILAKLLDYNQFKEEMFAKMTPKLPDFQSIKLSKLQKFENSENPSRESHKSPSEDLIIKSEIIRNAYSLSSDPKEIPFKIGSKYRYEDITARMHSKQTRVGCIWGLKYPEYIACTAGGKLAMELEFHDEELIDKSWYYFGQGASGNQTWNFANRQILEKKIFLFKTFPPSSIDKKIGINKNWYKFIGIFIYKDHNLIENKSKKRKGDLMIRFHLIPDK